MSPGLFASVAASSSTERLNLIESVFRSPDGPARRQEIGAWIMRLVPVETLVPESASRWRPLVADAMSFLFSRLSAHRLASKIVAQLELAPDTPPERRLITLISQMPGLQKLGQVLARNSRLAPSLRAALTGLENGMSDVSAAQVHAILDRQLGSRLEKFDVRVDPEILREASVSAVIGFSWKNPNRERERCVFKVLKPYVADCFSEDMSQLQQLGKYLTSRERGYGFAVRDIDQMLSEVRLLLEHEMDFAREQATLADALRTYRGSLGVRVPRVIPALCTSIVTAMTEEIGVKVTDAYRRSPIRRGRIAEQLIEALIAVPLFSGQKESVFHADPHAGNLFYDSPNRELIVLDWALAERLSLSSRRHLVMLAVMTILENADGVRHAIEGLRRPGAGSGRRAARLIARAVDAFFEKPPADHASGVLDAMRLLDRLALAGVRFDAPLFLFRKSLFTLDGVLKEIAGPEIRMDQVIVRYYLTRWAASFGLFYSPLGMKDFLSLEWNALLYPGRRLLARTSTGSARASRGSTPSPKKKSPRPGKSLPPAPPPPQSPPAG